MTSKQLDAIRRHGENLLAIFPNATERDPVKLCKKLRRLESDAAALALQGCNTGFASEDEGERLYDAVLTRVHALLAISEGDGGPNVFINRDPRGYQLKISSEYVKAFNLNIERDWGGYGIIAPEIGKEGN